MSDSKGAAIDGALKLIPNPAKTYKQYLKGMEEAKKAILAILAQEVNSEILKLHRELITDLEWDGAAIPLEVVNRVFKSALIRKAGLV